MKVMQAPYTFYPDPVGGTEIYVEKLAQKLLELNIESVIVAPHDKSSDSYVHGGMRVHRYRVNEVHHLHELYGEGDSKAAERFGRILDDEKPSVLHLHARSRGISIQVVREAKKKNIPVIFTYHTASVTCSRGSLLQWGEKVCDGKLDVQKCASCALHGLGLPRFAAIALASLPTSFGGIAQQLNLNGGAWTALRMRELIKFQQENITAFLQEVDHIVAVSEWSKQLMIENGVPQGKITFCRHGMDPAETATLVPYTSHPLKMVFMGRFHPLKGLSILLEAIRDDPSLEVELHIYGITEDSASDIYEHQLKARFRADGRVVFHEVVPHPEVQSILKNFHVMVIPSQALETGPMVLLEAFSVGLPVIASDLGGIAELASDGAGGILVKPSSKRAWQLAMRQCADDPSVLHRLRAKMPEVKKMSVLAQETLELYRRYQ